MRRTSLSLLNLAQCESGSSIIELAVIAPVLAFIMVGAVDLGRAYYMSVQLASDAEAGAIYGVNNPTDVAGIQSAAQADAPTVSGLTSTASYGCECSDGSNVIASCTTTPSCDENYINYVSVSTTANYNLLLPYPGFPSSFKLTSKSQMRVGGD
jgi:Flp pilus assembly protein TadG